MTSTQSSDLPDPPARVPFTKIDRRARTVRSFVRMSSGETLTAAGARKAAQALAGSVLKGVSKNHLFDTLLQYEGYTLDARTLDRIAGQVAGRHEELRKGPITPYENPVVSDWVAARVVRMEDTVWRDDEAGQLMHMLVEYGHPAGNVLVRKVPESYLRYLAYQVGFSRRVLYDEDPRHFVGLRFWMYMDVDPEQLSYRITTYRLNSAMAKHNRWVVRARMRFMIDLPEDPCPIEREFPCWDCTNVDCPAFVNK